MRLVAAAGLVLAAAYLALTLQLIPFTSRRETVQPRSEIRMPKYTYTLKVTDFAGEPFPGAVPRVRVRPTRDSSGPDGMLAAREIPVTLDSSGLGAVVLIATVDTVPEARYILTAEWLTVAQDGQEIPGWFAEWEFSALAGGGDIKTMADGAPASAIFYGPPWPSTIRNGLYIDVNDGEFGYKEAS